ncbi:GNAT family N-acetyltransferase [Euzebya tangerina]|uniref:GNAT family N-acetyltransferase n=1 Tax=Euzebya tangerina TaxID=591198 RepID=UPI000E31AF79|nr:GNAT family N-acetyltransferase [Euzebya tangerina]
MAGAAAALVLHDKPLADVDSRVLLGILRLRCDVFVVEQQCAYPEIDDDDASPSTRHIWVAPADEPAVVASYLRVINPVGSTPPASGRPQRVGRVVTAPSWRGRGLSRRLLHHVLDRHPGPTVLNAQSRLRGFYEGLGFEVVGPAFIEDGIPHLPMALAVPPSASGRE